MKAMRLFVQLTVYYAIIFGGAWLVIYNIPEFQAYLPVGGAQDLINSGSSKSSTLEAAAAAAHRAAGSWAHKSGKEQAKFARAWCQSFLGAVDSA